MFTDIISAINKHFSLLASTILEYCDELLEKAFAASTKKLGKVGAHITRTFQMFNLE